MTLTFGPEDLIISEGVSFSGSQDVVFLASIRDETICAREEEKLLKDSQKTRMTPSRNETQLVIDSCWME